MDVSAAIADPSVISAIKLHAIAQYPQESCGALTPDGYEPLVNFSPDPLHFFECNDAISGLREAGRLLGLVHSHPDGPDGPSAHDMAQQIAMDIPWGITLTDGKAASTPFFWSDSFEPPPLIGRRFRHGPSGTDGRGDCYALIRDYFRVERGIDLPEFPRSDNWWKQDSADLYGQGYELAGFRPADKRYPEIGDIGLIQMGRSRSANHGCIYIGGGRILHHFGGALSQEDSFLNYTKHLRVWIRHAG